MIRTRGLGQTLGRVIGRSIGREVSCDSDETPQRQRPTISACRQQEVALVAKDV